MPAALPVTATGTIDLTTEILIRHALSRGGFSSIDQTKLLKTVRDQLAIFRNNPAINKDDLLEGLYTKANAASLKKGLDAASLNREEAVLSSEDLLQPLREYKGISNARKKFPGIGS